MRKSRIFLYVFLFIILLGVVYFWMGKSSTKQHEAISNNQVIDEAFQLIKQEAVFSKNDKQIVEGAIRGMAQALEDPHSTYLTEEEATAHDASLAEERVGIGAEIAISDGKFIVVAPLKDSPASKAGLKPQDEIVRVNGERLNGKTLSDLVKMLSGEKGTSLKMTVYRSSEERHVELHMKRETIAMHSVSSEVYEVDGYSIGIVAISIFGEKTGEEWKTQTKALVDRGIDGLLIDVRGNPGGYLFSVSTIVSTLLENGKTFAYMQDPNGVLEMLNTESKEKPYLNKIPAVLLQNGNSASASEVLAGALKDNKRAMIVGETSYGKGTVQETHPLSNGGKLKISTHKWLTPKQEWIHHKGIQADLKVEPNELYTMDVKYPHGEFRVGDYGEEIKYAQNILAALGYNIVRRDGYFDEDTMKAVEKYREESKLESNKEIDDVFFQSLSKKISDYKDRKENDKQLQMGISYLIHGLKK
ncbi:PDZ domain-containing protein [Psychrobacillus glaciei]|uniref:PDZ domain-containing protein n=1 Tax=Psychrobacillus glaciei TaxID=2283160 RepID=A0A5J6SK32_9BACI|nr:S41 family peptidase [Psychrobacillus glaciei]QFF98218.1 PDZ domain-containing protein [Psychrobacillus glaciei]